MSDQEMRNLFNAALQPSTIQTKFVSSEPVTLKQIGAWAYERDYAPEGHWPAAMRQGWMRALRSEAWAGATQYLVAQGAMS